MLLRRFAATLVALLSVAVAAADPVPPKIATAIKDVSALPVFKTGTLDKASITALKALEAEPAFNTTDDLYLAKLDTDHPPRGWGAAGVWRNVTLTPVKVFRGAVKPNVAVTLPRRNPNHLGRKPKGAGLTEGSFYVVEARDGRVKSMTLATATNVQRAYVQGKLPLGWTLMDGKPRSPFKAVGGQKVTPSWTCSATGLAPAMLDNAVTITCKPVPPVKAIKWTNPDGDGDVTITITNTGKTPVEIPALRVADGKIDWARSLISLTSTAEALKTIKPVTKKKIAGLVKLDPNESVSCEACFLDLDSTGNVGGGRRINVIFGLGQKSTSLSFYWMDRHHGKLRKKLLSGK